HIALSRLRFPSGACGYQLDVIPRMGLWQDGMDYGHGTGHGVGFRLGVHEGPQVISPKPVNVKLEPGMVITNEPGIYRKGRYGIRIENIMVCREDEKNEFGDFLSFETLSLAPYHRALIDLALLDAEDIRWIDDYHATVRKRLSPLLTTDESRWLQAATEKLA
ncbi:MAG: Xaa-Pro aminopeptidase, partial [spirochete symbiont of Stewartia floridana]